MLILPAPRVIYGIENIDWVVSVYFSSDVEKFIVCYGCICELLNLRRQAVLPELRLVDCSALGTGGHT